jgi:hypothetical protein
MTAQQNRERTWCGVLISNNFMHRCDKLHTAEKMLMGLYREKD